MADFLAGVDLLAKFSGFLPILLVFIVVYALLRLTHVFGDNNNVDIAIALLLAGLMLFSPAAQYIISFMAPWFVVLFFFIIFILLAVKLFGTSDSDIMSFIKGSRYGTTVIWWVIAVSIIIALFAFSNVFGQTLLSQQSGTQVQDASNPGVVTPDGNSASSSFQNNLWSTLYNPKILGLAFILIVASFTIRFLSYSNVQ